MSLIINHQINSIKTSAGILDFSSNSGALTLPKGGTSARPTGAQGMIRFNTEAAKVELFDGTSWVVPAADLSGGTGLVVSDGTENHYRTIQPGFGIQVINGDGVAGNPTISMNANLDDLNNVVYSTETPPSSGDGLVATNTGTFTNISYGVRNIFPQGNYGINPWQRLARHGGFATTFTSVTDNTYGADRTRYRKSGTFIHNVVKSALVPDNVSLGIYYQWSYGLVLTTPQDSLTAANRCLIQMPIEAYDAYELYNRPMMVDFMVRAATPGIYSFSVNNTDTAGTAARSIVKEFTISASNVWERKVINFPALPVANIIGLGTNLGMMFSICLASGSNHFASSLDTWNTGLAYASPNQVNGVSTSSTNFNITGLRIYSGSTFLNRIEDSSRAETLSHSQRYFETSYNFESSSPPSIFYAISNGLAGGGTRSLAAQQVQYKTQKRITPDVNVYSANNGALNTWYDYGLSANIPTTNYASSTALQNNDRFYEGASVGGPFRRLGANWEADAEFY